MPRPLSYDDRMRRVVVGVVAAGCSFSHGAAVPSTPPGDASDGPASSDAPDAPPSDAAPLGPWGAPIAIFNAVGDDDPTLTGDLLELYFNRNADIYLATRTAIGQPWSVPAVVTELSSVANETTPEVSYDGLTMYLASDRIGTFGNDDIWVSTRALRTDAWGAPVHVDALSTTAEDAASAPSANGLDIVLTSGSSGNYDLYRGKRASTSAPWGALNPLTALDTTQGEYSPMLSADELTIYFDSDRAGNGDLFFATRVATTAGFSAPKPVSELNTTGVESDAYISQDDRHLFFTRDGVLYESTR